MHPKMVKHIFLELMRIFFDTTAPIYDIRDYQGHTRKQMLQGRKSVMRRVVLAPQLTSIRAQVLVRPELDTDEIIFPITEKTRFEFLFNGNPVRIFDLKSEHFQKDSFYNLPVSKAILLKRDPVLKTLLGFMRVAFAESLAIWVSSTVAESINMDQDGDAVNCIILKNLEESVEFRCRFDPTINIYCGLNQLKYTFIESNVLVFNRCRFFKEFTLKNFPTVQVNSLYEKYVKIYMARWIRSEKTYTGLLQLNRIWLEVHGCKIDFSTFEYTRGIFNGFLCFLCQMYGHYEANRVLNIVNRDCCSLIYYKTSEAVDTCGKNVHISFDVMTEPNMANDIFKDIILSGARASIEHLVDGLKIIKKANGISGKNAFRLDQECKHKKNGNDVIISKAEHGKHLAESSRNVPAIGHKQFKSAIQYHSIRFNDGRLNILDQDFGTFEINGPFILFDYESVMMILLDDY